MIKLLARLFIKNPDDTANPAVREKYGVICGGFGIFLNLLLAGFKLAAGVLAKSVAVTADAVNNLSDAGSSIITILGFKLASKKPDSTHPFGHGRLEYVAGLVVSFLIMLAGAELLRDSVKAVIPVDGKFVFDRVNGGLLPVIVLSISIVVKFYMYVYNHVTAKKIASAAMEATAKDSLSDTISTFVVLASLIVSHFVKTNLPLDGIAGIVVACFILYSGISAAKETLDPLLGVPPSHEFVKAVEEEVMRHKPIAGIHDFIVHDYGPGRLMLTLHAEVPGSVNIFELHDVIDNTESDLAKKFNCHVTIHMDPVDSDNPEVADLRKLVAEEAARIDGGITVHDLRIVPGPTHTNVIFDAVNPHSCALGDDELKRILGERVHSLRPNCYCVINVDHAFV